MALGIQSTGQADDEGEPAIFEVWPENWETLEVFLALDDCWQFDSEAGRFTGIDRVQME